MPAESDAAAVRPYVLDRSNLVVATAVAVVGERALTELATDLETAFDRFLVDPLKNDKLCRAKLAIVQALDKLEHLKRDVFQKQRPTCSSSRPSDRRSTRPPRCGAPAISAGADRRVGLSLPAGRFAG